MGPELPGALLSGLLSGVLAQVVLPSLGPMEVGERLEPEDSLGSLSLPAASSPRAPSPLPDYGAVPARFLTQRPPWLVRLELCRPPGVEGWETVLEPLLC